MRNTFRELETECQLNPNERATLTMANHGLLGTTWEFECSKAIIDESKEEGYDVICNFTQETCPVYLDLLTKADEMSDAEYEAISSK